MHEPDGERTDTPCRPLGLVVRATVQRIAADLHGGTAALAGLSPDERRRWLVRWSEQTRTRLSQLLALSDWLGKYNGRGMLDSMHQLLQGIERQRRIFSEAGSVGSEVQARQLHQWSRPYDVLTALQVSLSWRLPCTHHSSPQPDRRSVRLPRPTRRGLVHMTV